MSFCCCCFRLTYMILGPKLLKENCTESPDIQHRRWVCWSFIIFLVAQIKHSNSCDYASVTSNVLESILAQLQFST